MNSDDSPSRDTPDAASESGSSRSYATLFRVLAVGYLVWLAALAGILIAKQPDSGGALFLQLGAAWMPAAAFAILVQLVFGIVLISRGGEEEKKPVVLAVLAFAIPIMVTALFATVLSAINPVGAQDYPLMFGVLLLIFYIAGLVICHLLRRRVLSEPVIGFMATPLFGVLLVGAFMTVETVTSDEYIYRNAFVFEVEDYSFEDGKLLVSGVLTLNRGGDYVYEARAMSMMADPMEDLRIGEIRWESGSEPEEPGTYDVTVEWNDVSEQALQGLLGEEYFDSDFSFVIMRESEDGGDHVVLRHVPLRMDAPAEG